MTDKEKANLSYRFSGYQLPKIQLDETGHTYYYIRGVHPYFTTQPMYLQKPAYTTNTATIGNRSVYAQPSKVSGSDFPPTQATNNKLHCMLKI